MPRQIDPTLIAINDGEKVQFRFSDGRVSPCFSTKEEARAEIISRYELKAISTNEALAFLNGVEELENLQFANSELRGDGILWWYSIDTKISLYQGNSTVH